MKRPSGLDLPAPKTNWVRYVVMRGKNGLPRIVRTAKCPDGSEPSGHFDNSLTGTGHPGEAKRTNKSTDGTATKGGDYEYITPAASRELLFRSMLPIGLRNSE